MAHLIVHYHRTQSDYNLWKLAVIPGGHSAATSRPPSRPTFDVSQAKEFKQARRDCLTSFGAVFRLDLSHLPPSRYLFLLPVRADYTQQDTPPRQVDLGSLDSETEGFQHSLQSVFIAEHNPEAYSSPDVFKIDNEIPRFAFFSMERTPSHIPVLQLYVKTPIPSQNVDRLSPFEYTEVYPATPQYRLSSAPLLYIIDLLPLSRPCRIYILLSTDYTGFNPPPNTLPFPDTPFIDFPSSYYHFTFSNVSVPHRSTPVMTCSQRSEFEPNTAYLLNLQHLSNPSLSAHSPVNGSLPLPHQNLLLDALQKLHVHVQFPKRTNPTTLKIYLPDSSFVPSEQSTSLTVRPCGDSDIKFVAHYQKTDRDEHVFSIDLSKIPLVSLRKGLFVLSPLAEPFQWSLSDGFHVVLCPSFPRLLTPTDSVLRIYYHRLGDSADWEYWYLSLFVQESPESTPNTVVLYPSGPIRPGTILFLLPITRFSYGAYLSAEPSHSEEMVRNTDASPYLLGDGGDTIRILSADRRDVVKKWLNGHTPTDVHLVQGNAAVHARSPSHADLVARRKIRIRYRRFQPNDYDGWDLWAWDNVDARERRVSILPEPTSSHAWVDFVIDRSQFGSAEAVNFIPRRGGDHWLGKDEPVRVWKSSMLDNFPGDDRNTHAKIDGSIPTFFTTQASSLIFCSFSELRNSLVAHADSETSILLRTPVPIPWISPPRPECPNVISETKVTICDKEFVNSFLQSNGTDVAVRGRSFRAQKSQKLSPTEVRLFLKRTDVYFEEDFLVENVIVAVPGMCPVVLSWQRHDDWDRYLYPGTLGWEYRRDRCVFRCFSPTADLVSVVLYESATGKTGRKVIPMRRIPQGCWKAIVRKDLKGKFYKLLVEGENKRLFPGVEVLDPYSRCNSAHNGRGLIFGSEDTRVTARPNIKPSEAIIYEMHIRDLTIDPNSGIKNRGKFTGLAERGSRMVGFSTETEKMSLHETQGGVCSQSQSLDPLSTGLDHIVQMGATAVQILPVQDFDNDESNETDYNWGYMPVHFNSPDGWYASSTVSVARVTEFKQAVDAIHKAGLKVIMDVVYNHTAEDVNEYNLEARFSFNGLAPRYYYRTCGNTPIAANGDSTCGQRPPHEPRCGECYSNGSGCGNEFRSDAPMGRKFIIDSLKYWVKEYQIDGFRFDLMGLIDVETLTQAASELHQIDSNIMLYGEPWCGGLSPVQVTEKGMQRSKGFGVFNDNFRDAIRGSSFQSEETFVMDGGRQNDIKGGIIGSIDSFCDAPFETINYVECHDNYTLWDHFRFYVRSRADNIKFSEEDFRRMHRLAAVLILTSQGVPFIQAGQEMCRTKFDVENSYNSPDEINMIRWDRKMKELSTVRYYRGLILLRRSHPEIFCKGTSSEIRNSLTFYEDLGLPVPDRCIAYRIKGNPKELFVKLMHDHPGLSKNELEEESLRWTEVVLLFNPTPVASVFHLPGANDDCMWFQIVDASYAGLQKIRGPAIGLVEVAGRSAAVLRRASKKDFAEAQTPYRLSTITDSYCCYHGDDPLGRYAVGLDAEPDLKEKEERRVLRESRSEFERRRKTSTLRRNTILTPDESTTEKSDRADIDRSP